MVKQRKRQQKSVGHPRCLAYPLARTTELVMFIKQPLIARQKMLKKEHDILSRVVTPPAMA